MKDHNYFVYIITNQSRKSIYVGMTNNLSRRLKEHYEYRGNQKSWAGRYHCHYLVWWERHRYVLNAITREKEIKKWRREKKVALIKEFNPEWQFLNIEVQE